jgi:hypothetical protein
MDPVTNEGIGIALRYALYFSGTLASILVCINMLKARPDFRELAASMEKNFGAWRKANEDEHKTHAIEQATLRERSTEHERRLNCIDQRCREEKELIRDLEKRLHERIDLMSSDLSAINGTLGGVVTGLKGVGRQLDVISKKMIDGGKQ